jgi:hypothetical protein
MKITDILKSIAKNSKSDLNILVYFEDDILKVTQSDHKTGSHDIYIRVPDMHMPMRSLLLDKSTKEVLKDATGIKLLENQLVIERNNYADSNITLEYGYELQFKEFNELTEISSIFKFPKSAITTILKVVNPDKTKDYQHATYAGAFILNGGYAHAMPSGAISYGYNWNVSGYSRDESNILEETCGLIQLKWIIDLLPEHFLVEHDKSKRVLKFTFNGLEVFIPCRDYRKVPVNTLWDSMEKPATYTTASVSEVKETLVVLKRILKTIDVAENRTKLKSIRVNHNPESEGSNSISFYERGVSQTVTIPMRLPNIKESNDGLNLDNLIVSLDYILKDSKNKGDIRLSKNTSSLMAIRSDNHKVLNATVRFK